MCCVAIVRRKALFVLCFNHLRAHQLSRSTLRRRTIRTIASAIAAIEKRQKKDKLSMKIRLMNRYKLVYPVFRLFRRKLDNNSNNLSFKVSPCWHEPKKIANSSSSSNPENFPLVCLLYAVCPPLMFFSLFGWFVRRRKRFPARCNKQLPASGAWWPRQLSF